MKVSQPLKSFWFSSSKNLFFALYGRMKNASSDSRQIVEGEGYIADKEWTDKNGSPQKRDWDNRFYR